MEHPGSPGTSAGDFTVDGARTALLAAIVPHVPFDGWSKPAFDAAVADIGMDPALAALVCPRGAVDLAAASHREGDAEMMARLAAEDLSTLRMGERVALAVRYRLEAADPELVRRGAAVFALPQHAALGASLIWGTSDAIWRALGDTSQDAIWYTKRLSLGGIYSATLLYWMGDESEGRQKSWTFLERRIDDALRLGKLKASVARLPGIGRIVERCGAGIWRPAVRPEGPGRQRSTA